MRLYKKQGAATSLGLVCLLLGIVLLAVRLPQAVGSQSCKWTPTPPPPPQPETSHPGEVGEDVEGKGIAAAASVQK